MTAEEAQLSGPDFTQGIEAARLADGAMLLGYANGEAVLLARRGAEIFAIGAVCTHYNGPLAEGLLVDDTVRCPWHHACFSLRTGEALRAPALNPVACWKVEQADGKVFVREKAKRQPAREAGGDRGDAEGDRHHRRRRGGQRGSRDAAARGLRRLDHHAQRRRCGRLTIGRTCRRTISPARRRRSGSRCARPTSTRQNEIELRLDASRRLARSASARAVAMSDGSRMPFDALLLATGARAVRLDVPGADLPHVHYLRTLADSRAHRGCGAGRARRRDRRELHRARGRRRRCATRGLEVHVVGPRGAAARARAGRRARRHRAARSTRSTASSSTSARAPPRSTREAVTLTSGERIAADLVVVGIGVRPATALAEQAGLTVDRGVDGRRVPRDERARHLRRRRHRALARSAHRQAHPRRALGRRRAAGPDRRAQHARAARAVRRRAVLLEPALRLADQLRRPRREAGTASRSRASRRIATARSAISRAAARSRWPPSGAISTACGRKWSWSAVARALSRRGSRRWRAPRSPRADRSSTLPDMGAARKRAGSRPDTHAPMPSRDRRSGRTATTRA